VGRVVGGVPGEWRLKAYNDLLFVQLAIGFLLFLPRVFVKTGALHETGMEA
jgi:hypothetical protein